MREAMLDSIQDYQVDLSLRLEGVMQVIGILSKTLAPEFTTAQRETLSQAIIGACGVFKQTETIGRGTGAKQWPTNRFALTVLTELGCARPGSETAAA